METRDGSKALAEEKESCGQHFSCRSILMRLHLIRGMEEPNQEGPTLDHLTSPTPASGCKFK